MEKTDEQLIEEYFSDFSEAFEQLVSRYLKLIYNFIYSISKDPEVSSELTQETFLKVWKSLIQIKNLKFGFMRLLGMF